jgi:DNA-binding XRE family transcriptional regulator
MPRLTHCACHPAQRPTTSPGSPCGTSAEFCNCDLHPHRFVALLPPPPLRAETPCIPKGLSAPAPNPRRAHPPAPDGPRADATNPRGSVGLVVRDRRGVGAGAARASGLALASHRAGPRSGARSGTGRGLPGRVRAARLRLGLTQEQVAAGTGLDSRTVRNVETGRHRPSRRTLGRLAEVLGPV